MRTHATGWIIALAALLLCVACTSGFTSRANGEPAPQVLHPAENVSARLASCGGHPFPLDALDATATDQVGPEYDALRGVLAKEALNLKTFPGQQPWRLVDEQDGRLTFIADSEIGLVFIAIRRQGDGWTFDNMGDCQLHAMLADGTSSSPWRLDPRRPLPSADALALEILVQERACASGRYATGRILDPNVLYEESAITITVAVREVGGTCPSNPDTPAVLILGEPLGDRQLLDGFFIPPAAPHAAD